MLHNEARKLLVEAYEKTHDVKGVALAYGVSVPTVYRLAEQKAKTRSVDLRVSERGHKHVLGQEALERIAKMIHASEQERPRCAGERKTMEWVCEENGGISSVFSG